MLYFVPIVLVLIGLAGLAEPFLGWRLARPNRHHLAVNRLVLGGLVSIVAAIAVNAVTFQAMDVATTLPETDFNEGVWLAKRLKQGDLTDNQIADSILAANTWVRNTDLWIAKSLGSDAEARFDDMSEINQQHWPIIGKHRDPLLRARDFAINELNAPDRNLLQMNGGSSDVSR